jgi:hypothetical protein
MESDIKFIYWEKSVLIISVLVLTFFIYHLTAQKNYLITGGIFAAANIIDYYLKKKRLLHLYDTYEEEQLKQLKYVNWKK